MPRDDLKRGAAFMIASGALFAGMGAIVKLLSESLPNEMVVFFRSAIGLVVLLPWLWHRAHSLKTEYLRIHLTRGLAGLAAMYCYFYAIAHLHLAEATLLNYSTPLFIPFIAWMWLREGIAPKLWWAIIIGFIGILLILKPGLDLFSAASVIGLASGVFAALAMVSIRRLSHTEPTSRIVFYFSLVCTVGSALPLWWYWRTPEPQLWLWLVAMGALASAAQMLLTRAYAYAPAAQVGPFTYITVIFAAIAAWIFWGEILDVMSVAGAALVCLGGVLTIRFVGRRATVPPADLPNMIK